MAAVRRPAEATRGRLGRGLLGWFDEHRRDLPWRRDADPYRILVSEIMLQQTRVEVVIPRYREFLSTFPDVGTLAAAGEEEVRSAWSGLGYYRRAERLQAAAREVVDRGGFPRSAERLETLPGIGAYTAAAVASIAFGEAVPVLDGNVERVLSRLTGERELPRRAAVRRRLLVAAADLLDPSRPGDSNQALMELGALVCTPRRPRCDACPLAAACVARAEGATAEIPRRPEPRPRRSMTWHQVVVTRSAVDTGEEILLERRSREPLAGRWLLPGWRVAEGREQTAEPGPTDVVERLGERGLEVEGPLAPVAGFRHAITSTDYRVVLWCARPVPSDGRWSGVVGEAGEGSGVGGARWVRLSDFDERGRWRPRGGSLPTSSMLAKAVRAVRRRLPVEPSGG